MPSALRTLAEREQANRLSSYPSYFGQSFYHETILPLAVVTAVLSWLSLPSPRGEWPAGFTKFMVTYLSAWTVCVTADWLQGPYVYALYEAYGFEPHVIAQLFVTGFASALFCSCFVGSLADRFGRKKCCIAYCVLYIISCATKHVFNYWVLVFGRITGGFATSLLFSCFECWMVSEHTCRHQFSSNLLSYMFGLKYVIMYLMAIISGFVSQIAVDATTFKPLSPGSNLYFGGNTVPFDMSAGILFFAMVVIAMNWEENYGDSAKVGGHGGDNLLGNFKDALQNLFKNSTSLRLCITVSFFEGGMYAFVYNWTPALETETEQLPYGIVFSLMMMACMAGASTSTLVASYLNPVQKLAVICTLSVLAFCVAARSPAHVCFVAFLLFEFCVGVYYPSAGVLKSEVVPEHIRGTMYNLYRVPLNAVVVGLLLTDLSPVQCFNMCAVLLSVALLAVLGIMRNYNSETRASEVSADVNAAKKQ